MTGGLRAFLRRGKFVQIHSELDDFLKGRITRQQGMQQIRRALQGSISGASRLRKETLSDLRAWDSVYLDHIASGRIVPGEPTAAAQPLHGLGSNEALLMRHAREKRLLRKLPPMVQRSLQSRLKKLDQVWKKDAQDYDRVFAPPKARRPAPAPRKKAEGRKRKAKSRSKKKR